MEHVQPLLMKILGGAKIVGFNLFHMRTYRSGCKETV